MSEKIISVSTTTTFNFLSGGAIPPKVGTAVGGVPAGKYKATFIGVEHLPALPADPMTGKSKRKFDCVRFNWRISEGEFAGRVVNRECPPNTTSLKSKFIKTVEMLTGSDPSNGWTIEPCIGQQYTVQVGYKIAQNSVPTKWLEVINCM